MKVVKYICDKCGEESKDKAFWMSIELRDKMYLFDDGTQERVYSKLICRSCKILFLKRTEKWINSNG